MTDQHRVDHFGRMPGARCATPNLNRVAEGMAFSGAVSVNPVCMPARSALLTGKYTHQIGALAMSGDLSPQHPTFPRSLQKAGYQTHWVGKTHWHQGWPWDAPRGAGHDFVKDKADLLQFGFDSVFEVSGKQLVSRNYCDWAGKLEEAGLLERYRDWIDSEGGAGLLGYSGDSFPFSEALYPDIVIADETVRRLKSLEGDRPFFLAASFCGPHPPFDPPGRFLEESGAGCLCEAPVGDETLSEDERTHLRKLRRSYGAMVRCLDEQVGRILACLEEAGGIEETVVFFTSDHGEMLGDRGRLGKQLPYRQSAGVPLAIRHPDFLSGAINGSPVELTDVTATILDCAGLDPVTALGKEWPAFHDRVPSRSLLPILRGETASIRDFAFSEFGGPYADLWQSLRDERYQYIHWQNPSRSDQLFDLGEDPESGIDISGREPERVATFQSRLRDLLDRTPPAQLNYAPLP